MTINECVKYYEETGKDKFYSVVDEDLDIVFWGFVEGRNPYSHSSRGGIDIGLNNNPKYHNFIDKLDQMM